MYEFGRETPETRAANFFRQAKFMEDYEDDAPWNRQFTCYFPTYRELTTNQLRGYFAWRTHVRKGEYLPISASAAYLYLYELLNGIGADSPEDALRRMQAFEEGFLDAGHGDESMRRNLRRWMTEYAVIRGLPPETARAYADPDMLRRDGALAVLRDPRDREDGEIFRALTFFDGGRTERSPVIRRSGERGMRLFGETWKTASVLRGPDGRDLFALCFGQRTLRRWYPLSNTVFHQETPPGDMELVLDECRRYRCTGGVWQVEAYEKPGFDRDRFLGFLHETDLRLRRYLKTGHYLRQRPQDAWADPFIDAAIEADRQAVAEASRPKIDLDLSGLDRIREDALLTRDSLLTEEELAELERAGRPADAVSGQDQASPFPEQSAESPGTAPGEGPACPDPALREILRAVLSEGGAGALVRELHLTPSLAADAVNEALFDEFGDNVLSCEDGVLVPVEDYREELERMLGGMKE